jgi:D-psicose/D-tagatose/L-ribulose 3-epimerase
MKYGIYYAYWEKEWAADYRYYIEKVAKLGFDILEIAATPIVNYSDREMVELKACAAANGIILTAGHGPSAEQNLSSPDPAVRANAKAFFTNLLQRLKKMDIRIIGGAIYSYWPVDYSKPIDKQGDWERSVESVREISRVAGDCGVDYCLEVLNRFEGYLLNTSEEAVAYCDEIASPGCRILLDTFHLNIEEDSIGGAIRHAGKYLKELHLGETNRKPPGLGRMPWAEIRQALDDVRFEGALVMEPFIMTGGAVGRDVGVWRELIDRPDLDGLARASCAFVKRTLV